MFNSAISSPGRKYLYGLISLSFVSLICVAFSTTGSDDFDIARREILLRRIGHEILLQAGDSTSRVLLRPGSCLHEPIHIGFESFGA